MEIVIFGATGQVGRHLVSQALLKKFKVRAYGRNVHELSDTNKDLKLVKAGVFDDLDVLKAIKGCDAVFSVLGGAFDGTDKTRSLGIKTITAQMKKAGVNRIIALGGKGILDAPEGGLLIDQEDYPAEYIPVGREHQKAWEFLRDSNLDWTFVCSPDIINAGPSGKFITEANMPPTPDTGQINAGDLALFMLNELDRHEYSKQRVGISEV
ncbi:NAD(P)-dependent oxidoreductase [Flavihumibacter profundi]|uniref:NAD(P)-dependent oxidoreductase n=1 Tax=Flavihumibacter profundi TaxID=2716883 RepID=UPI001CC3477A|nr:NAD(P)H-binding protein [Flavihumibacter profundi]MBZ5856640.1 NAD(P)H-binding protein [Flavihumibacter profundi]